MGRRSCLFGSPQPRCTPERAGMETSTSLALEIVLGAGQHLAAVLRVASHPTLSPRNLKIRGVDCILVSGVCAVFRGVFQDEVESKRTAVSASRISSLLLHRLACTAHAKTTSTSTRELGLSSQEASNHLNDELRMLGWRCVSHCSIFKAQNCVDLAIPNAEPARQANHSRQPLRSPCAGGC
jgi:hypothetical protein